MAQVELRFFKDMEPLIRRGIADLSKRAVAEVHYPFDERAPGEITLIVPKLDLDLSESDAHFELEVSSGAENWPRDENGDLLLNVLANQVLDDRAERISQALQDVYSAYPHNIFEVAGNGTGWFPYIPSN